MAGYNYITRSGVIVPDVSDLKAEVQAEYRAALGENLSLDDETPQGVLIAGEVSSRISVAENNANLANQINPNEAGGIFLDALGALVGLERPGATQSVVTGVSLTGVAGTNLPAGTRARTAAGDVFELVNTVTIPATGVFRAVEAGPVPCAIGALSIIVDAVLGWEGVTNADAASVGRAELSDAEFRRLRRQALAPIADTTVEAIRSRVLTVSGVKSAVVYENKSEFGTTVQGVAILGRSIYCCADGGSDEDIGFALHRTKTLGAQWTGGTSVYVFDSGFSYEVRFDRPDDVDILVEIDVRANGFSGDITQTVIDAIVSYANGEVPGDNGFAISEDVSPFEVASAVNYYAPQITVLDVQLAKASIGVFSPSTINIFLNQIARVQASGITVNIST